MRCQTIVSIQSVVLSVFIGLTAPMGQAEDHFLTIGGGYDPSGNQMSLESNVLFAQRVLAEERPDEPAHDVYFADGNDPNRDLQYIDDEKAENCPAALRIMTELFGKHEEIGTSYRSHTVPDVIGPTERAAIRRKFRQLSRELESGDRLIVYVTGHGGEAESAAEADYDYEYDYEQEKWVATATDGQAVNESDQHNTLLYLWDSEAVEAREFGRWLDRLDPEVTVVLVMVQCYSGGFAHSIFQRHSPDLGLSPARRCGFFSQVHDRAAAGCTPESDEADYQEYSTYFWAALGGKTRTNETIERPDYNGDGKISFAEAHAYAVIESDTIDIPIRTSDAFLRNYSHLAREAAAEQAEDAEDATPVSRLFGLFGADKTQSEQTLVEASGLLSELSSSARDDQRVILEQLPLRLGLATPVTVEAVRLKLTQAKSDVTALSTKISGAHETGQNLKSELREDVYLLWPELNGGFSPMVLELATKHSKEFVKTVDALVSYQAWQSAKNREDELSEELLSAQCQEARVQRLLKTIETIALAANLPKVAPSEIVDRYRQLVSLEEQTLDRSL